jgi:hypothetical protein
MYQLLEELDSETAVDVAYFFVRMLRHRGVLTGSDHLTLLDRSGEVTPEERHLALALWRQVEARIRMPLDSIDAATLREVVSDIGNQVNEKLASAVTFDASRARRLLHVMRSGGDTSAS